MSQIADDKNFIETGQRKIRLHHDPSKTIDLGTGPVGNNLAQRRGLHPGRPQDGPCWQARFLAALRIAQTGMVRIQLKERGMGAHLDTQFLQRFFRLCRQIGRVGREKCDPALRRR